MFEALLAVLQVTIIYHVNYVEGRDSIAFVFVPLSSEAAMRLGVKPNGSEKFIPCSNCFFKFDRPRDRLIQYYNRPSFGETLEPCGCFEYVKKIFTNLKKPALITVSQNIITIDTSVYYGVMKTDQCRLDSMKSMRTVDGLQLGLLMRCS